MGRITFDLDELIANRKGELVHKACGHPAECHARRLPRLRHPSSGRISEDWETARGRAGCPWPRSHCGCFSDLENMDRLCFSGQITEREKAVMIDPRPFGTFASDNNPWWPFDGPPQFLEEESNEN